VDANQLPNSCAVLHHVLPDGSAHHDWLIDRGDGGLLVTFRCDASPSEAAAFVATRVPDHRRIYLTYEGAISGNRGTVRRVASGSCLIRVDAPDAFIIDACFDGGDLQRFSARLLGGQAGIDLHWRFLSARIGWQDDTSCDILQQ
jgi:hypothetical protein